MKINTKFDIGQTVYTYEAKRVFNKSCSFCNGKGKVICESNDGKLTSPVDCPECNGTGYTRTKDGLAWSTKDIYRIKNEYVAGNRIISDCDLIVKSINITEDFISYVFDIDLSGYNKTIEESKLFATEEECQAWCDKMNEMQEFD